MNDGAASADLGRLKRRLDAVRDPALHSAVILRHVQQSTPERLVQEFSDILRGAGRGWGARLYDSVRHFLLWGDGMPDELSEALYRAARERGLDGVAYLFLDPPPRRAKSGWIGDPDPDIADRTLGERKSLARRPNRRQLERMLRVAEPSVTQVLLENPRLTEADVVWIAARRPNTPGVLEQVARSFRWSSNPRVRLALVQNPYAPTRIAVLLCPLLAAPELREVARDPAAHPLVREMAKVLTRLRVAPRREADAGPQVRRVIAFPTAESGEE